MRKSEILKMRAVIEKAVQSLDDKTALTAVRLFPAWADLLTENYEFTTEDVAKGFRCKHGDVLYKVIQPHVIQAGWSPDLAPAIFVAVNETNAGSIEDPIPAVAGMEYKKDLYYIYNDVIYLCIRQDTENGTVLHFTPDQLVGHYFEVVK